MAKREPSWLHSDLLEKQGWSDRSPEPAWMRSELLEKQGWSAHREKHKDCPRNECLVNGALDEPAKKATE